ncbi:MAG: hypothetical protein ABIP27_16715 [Flavobacterium circumlabens]|uniref:hypothetical protein n=1 Tax=Flavobacterium circumlabens TaxID=2133765 RepID=UPI0032667197
MEKQFTKITKTYSAKNRLCTAILDHFESLDHSLFPNKKEAVNDIKSRFNAALESYKGKAAVPKLECYMFNKNDIVYQVEDVIHISIYNVIDDLS